MKEKLFNKKLTWLGYHITQIGVKPIKDKTEAIINLKAPTNTKELKSFLGSIQHLSKVLKKPFQEDRPNEITEEGNQIGMDPRSRRRLQTFEEGNRRSTLPLHTLTQRGITTSPQTHVAQVWGNFMAKRG